MARIAILLLLSALMTTSSHAQPSREQFLIAAASRGDLGVVERLIEQGASVTAHDGKGRTALLAATQGDYIGVARALIAAGADVNAKDDTEDSPFLYAGAEGRNAILKMTLPTADLKSTNRYGGTALIPAAHHGHPETVRILLGTAIDKDHVNKLGWTALLEAVVLGDGSATYQEIVQLLLRAGAKPNIADRDGVTPLQHAERHGYKEIARILKEHGGT